MAAGIIMLAACNDNDHKGGNHAVKQYSIEQLYKTKSIGGGFFNKDESKLLVNNNETGIYNLYEINLWDTSMKALTFSDSESLFALDYVPGTDKTLYRADHGGNENSHLFLRNPDGTSRDLTPGEKEKSIFFGWNRDKNNLYYVSNKRDPKFFDLYKMDTSRWLATMIYRNDSNLDVSEISHNERYLLLTRNITTDKNEMFLFDRLSQSLKKISTDTEDATYQPQGFELNDSSFYYLTNEGKEFSYVAKYNIYTGAKEKTYETHWDVSYQYISEHGKFRVISVNEDGKNKVLLFDNKSGDEIKIPGIKEGDVQRVNISPSEKKMILYVASDKSPVNLWCYNFTDQSLKQLTKTLSSEINPDDLVKADVVRFKSFDSKDIPAIFYKPLNASKDAKVPALVWVHGGPGGQSRANYSQAIQYFVNHGYAILMVNNRGSSGYGKSFYKMDNKNHGDKDLLDCVYGKRWLASQDFIDSSKIGIYGGSYGGFMSLAGIIFHPGEFKVCVDMYGVANWPRTLKSIPPYWESIRKALYEEMGDPHGADSTRLKNISPLYNTERIKNPLLVLQGSNDPRVLPVESDEIVAGAKKNGTPVVYIKFPDEGHGFLKKENQMKAAEETLKFLDKYLKGTWKKPGLD